MRQSRWPPSNPLSCFIVYRKRSSIIPVFIFGHKCSCRHDISRSDPSQQYLHAVSAKGSVCLHVSRAVSRLWPSDVRGIVWHWTLIGQSRIYFSPVGLIWLYFFRQWLLLIREEKVVWIFRKLLADVPAFTAYSRHSIRRTDESGCAGVKSDVKTAWVMDQVALPSVLRPLSFSTLWLSS